MMKPFSGLPAAAALLIMIIATCALAEPLTGEIPSELARWRAWVLHDHEDALCPAQYNNGAVVRCQWPSQLDITISDEGGRFEQRWQIFSSGWVALPGSADLWPEGVVVDGRSVAVIQRNQVPSIYLTPGTHLIKGQFAWTQAPEMMHVPPASGLLVLSVAGQKISAPQIDAKGRLWLQEQEKAASQEDRLNVTIFRRINDTIPMQIDTVLRLEVSGQAREIGLADILLPGAIPMQLDGRLPARIDPQGRLLVQARPGLWQIELATRMPENVQKISRLKTPYGQEIWSFQAQHHLRMVELSGAVPVEPGQTEMPGSWRRFPAYLIKERTTLVIKEVRRGDPDPAPDQLALQRRWWLDFDGGGFTVHDKIQGVLSRQWSLAVDAPMTLGRVAIDGQAQVITAQGAPPKAGVELRHGQLNLEADARLPERTVGMAALGWAHDFQKVAGQLHLPPGWRLMATRGVDQVSDTWLQQWSLLDFFLVLIVALAVFKLRNWKWGLLALTTMVLIYHEPGAPRMVWLHILAVLALLPLLPAGWLKRLVAMWGIAAGIVLLIMAIPFVANQIRWGVYPQLAPHNDYTGRRHRTVQALPAANEASMGDEMHPEAKAPQRQKRDSLSKLPSQSSPIRLSKPVQADLAFRVQDPDALIPTGPGLPDWHWQTISLGWNGPVAKDQTLHLYLLSPLMNLILAFIRVGLLVVLIWGVFDWRPWWQKIRQQLQAKAVGAGFLLVVIAALPSSDVWAAQDGFPPPALLEELRQRLLAPPECLPHCADISRLELSVTGDELQVMIKIHAADPTAVPLPVSRKSWAPSQIMMDNAPINGLARDEGGTLWAVVSPGLHTIILRGNISDEGLIQIPLPLKPHQATYMANGWAVKGILPDGRVGSSIQLNRLQTKPRDAAPRQGSGALLPFLEVERVFSLGLTWKVQTTVKRLTPLGAPVVVNVPLLANESVTTAGLPVKDKAVLVNMSSDQSQATYSSTLMMQPKLELKAPRAVPWTEVWILDASPIWHCDLAGIAPIHHQSRAGQWQPRWQPWPGDSVTIQVERPQAIEGQLVTIELAHLTLTPGQRFGAGELVMKISTSRGSQHAVELPPKANLQKVLVNGKSLPIRQDGQWVTLPLQPGIQTVSVQWHQLSPFGMLFKAPRLKIGEQAVNAKVTFKLPDRWILWVGGPNWGPAVLFWSYLIVIVIAAAGLGRLTITPLKSWQWLLLGLGMTQIPPVMALLIVGWLLALGLRERQSMPGHWLGFNALQIGLIFWSVVALGALFAAVKAGLIGQPEMQIAGNQSTGGILHWTQDHIGASMPQAWVFSLPVWVYRALMLAWSLWLALALLGWLKWGWRCFVQDGGWRKMPPRQKGKPKHEKAPSLSM